MSAKINKLLIKVNGVPAGHITTRKTHDGGTRYSFNYLPDAGPEQALSLTMPVRDESYATWQMPPALEMSLPEGLLKDNLVRRFGKLVTMDPMGLLWITGRSRVGNITAELPADNSNDELLELDRTLRQQQQQQAVKDIEDITSVTDDELETLFEGLLQDYATGSGVSGMQPKVLAKTLVQSKDNPQRALFKTATHIIKTSKNDLPYLALNEHLCLRVAALSGLDVPRRVVSDNGEVIILKRFDLRRSGGRYYVEDGCVLQGRTADNRYEGSMENLVATLLRTISGRHKQNTGRQLYALTAVNTLVRNGDAHLKNFSILYEHPDNVKLAKAYDITTTSAYRLFRRDEPALLMNSAKRWPTEKELITFGRKHCMLDDRVCREILKTVIRAVTKVGKTIPNEIKAHPGSEHVLSAMVVQWNDAIKSLYFKKDGQKKTCKTELDDVERALIDRYGDPYKNQKDRKDRLGKISVPQRTVMHPPTL